MLRLRLGGKAMLNVDVPPSPRLVRFGFARGPASEKFRISADGFYFPTTREATISSMTTVCVVRSRDC